MKLYSAIKDRIRACDLRGEDVFAAFSLSFVIASLIFALGGNYLDLSYVRQYPFWIPLLITAAGTVIFSALTVLIKTKKPLAWALTLCTLALAVILVLGRAGNIFLCLGTAFVLLIVARYVTKDDKLGISLLKPGDIHSLAAVCVLVVAFTAAVYVITAAKYKAFYHSAYDFGIFCQMFESMAETGLPLTTVERNETLSHFAVHFSPFFYLLLPVYFVFRSPLTLLFMQALGVALGAFPVRRICRTLGMSPLESCAAAAAYLLYPTMANGCLRDFHENKFLSVLILWAIAFALEKKMLGTGIFCFLILTVKEDAFIYVLAICIWMLVTKRCRLFAVIGAFASVLWFFFACEMISLSGGEIMSTRFANYSLSSQGGLLDAVRTCFIDIGFLLNEVFAGADTEAFKELTYSGQKLEFILWTAAPLLFTPFLRKRPSELILLFPVLVINLMPSWLYQYDVDFQYTYGTCALLFAGALLFLGEHKGALRRFALTSMLLLCIVFSSSLFVIKAQQYTDSYYKNREKYDATAELLKTIPKDSSVTAYGYMVPHLWYVDELRSCPVYYGELLQTEYYVIDLRYDYDNHTAKMLEAMGDSYELYAEEGYVQIYRLRGADESRG